MTRISPPQSRDDAEMFAAVPVATAAMSEHAPDHRFAERRAGDPRVPVARMAYLAPFGGTDDILCVANDLGPRGAYVTAPIGFGVAVGQRYQLVLAPPGVVLGQALAGTGDRAVVTVVRTEIQTRDAGDRLGVGLRFDQPLARS